MIDLLDNLIRDSFIADVPGITDVAQVRFQPPDEDWRTTYVPNLTVGGQPANALNVYLADVRENRKLRTNERERSTVGAVAFDRPAPVQIDLHYLISAWSPAAISPAIEPTLDEHLLLYETVASLERRAPFNPSRIYAHGSAALLAWPERDRERDLPTTVLPSEGFPKLSEFWHGMGQGARWKPAIYLIVTLPVELPITESGGIITAAIADLRRRGQFGPGEVVIDIGTRILDGAGDAVPGAWVRLETTAGVPIQVATANADGQATFLGLRTGVYRLRARASGLGEKTRLIDVPSVTGEYDVQF